MEYAFLSTVLMPRGHLSWSSRISQGKNWAVTQPGVYKIQFGAIVALEFFPPSCPGSPICSNHGQCDSNSGTCNCLAGYWGPDCSGSCPGGGSSYICGGHGHCLDGASGNGQCVCDPGWAVCNAKVGLCDANIRSDPSHCGACDTPCKVGPGVVSATCLNSTCSLTCDSGYTKCFGQCVPGSKCEPAPLPGCNTFQNNQCAGNQIDTPPQYEASRWWTPHRKDADYLPSYQDYYRLVGHANIQYAADLQSATVTIVTLHRNTSKNIVFKYLFDGVAQPSNSKEFTSSYNGILNVQVLTSDGAQLQLDPIDFAWNAPAIAVRPGDYRSGQKGAIVEFFGWPHSDIEAECADLAKMGYLGAKCTTKTFSCDFKPPC
jgi:hypothetical protein